MKYAVIASGEIGSAPVRTFAKRFVSRLLFAFMILVCTVSFAQRPSPAESNKALPASTASDTVDVQHVIDAYHKGQLQSDAHTFAGEQRQDNCVGVL